MCGLRVLNSFGLLLRSVWVIFGVEEAEVSSGGDALENQCVSGLNVT